MKVKIIIALVVLLVGGLATYGVMVSNLGTTEETPDSIILEQLKNPELIPEISWNMLYKYDYQNSKGPEDLMAMDGQLVKIPGYIVPLSSDYSKLEEFLLVPDGQSCIHVPPPPPNLIVTVNLREAVPMEEVYNPSWIYGIFKVEESFSVHGGSSFKLDGVQVEEFDLYGY